MDGGVKLLRWNVPAFITFTVQWLDLFIYILIGNKLISKFGVTRMTPEVINIMSA